MKKRGIILLILIVFLIGACSSNIQSSNLIKTDKIVISNFKFDPDLISIKVGDTVTWKHDDKVSHIIKSSEGLFESNTLVRGDEFTFTFTKAGEYNYYCSLHPTMKGRIIVE